MAAVAQAVRRTARRGPKATTSPARRPVQASRFGTAENPLAHPVTGERIVFLRRARDTAGELLEMMVYMAPGGFVATPHVHPKQEERFEIGGAEVIFRIGRVERRYRPGDIVIVPPGTPHTWWNPSQQ